MSGKTLAGVRVWAGAARTLPVPIDLPRYREAVGYAWQSRRDAYDDEAETCAEVSAATRHLVYHEAPTPQAARGAVVDFLALGGVERQGVLAAGAGEALEGLSAVQERRVLAFVRRHGREAGEQCAAQVEAERMPQRAEASALSLD